MDNQRMAIVALVVSVCLACLLFFFLYSRSPENVLTSKSSTETDSKASDSQYGKPGGHPGNGTVAPAAGNTPPEMTPAQPDVPPINRTSDTMALLEEKAGRLRDHRRKMADASARWLRGKVDDKNLTEKTREVYRLRLLPEMKEGIRLLEANDYAGALREFEKAIANPDASPVSKHLMYDYMLQAAAKWKNKMLYATLFRAQAVLQRDHDLGVLGLEKSSQAVEYAEYFTEHLKAANDAETFDRIVERDRKNIGASEKDREKIAADVKRRIREFEEFFQ